MTYWGGKQIGQWENQQEWQHTPTVQDFRDTQVYPPHNTTLRPTLSTYDQQPPYYYHQPDPRQYNPYQDPHAVYPNSTYPDPYQTQAYQQARYQVPYQSEHETHLVRTTPQPHIAMPVTTTVVGPSDQENTHARKYSNIARNKFEIGMNQTQTANYGVQLNGTNAIPNSGIVLSTASSTSAAHGVVSIPQPVPHIAKRQREENIDLNANTTHAISSTSAKKSKTRNEPVTPTSSPATASASIVTTVALAPSTIPSIKSTHMTANALNRLSQRIHICAWKGCTKRYTHASSLAYHWKTHTGENQLQCTWPGCPKLFAIKSKLLIHLRTHTGEKGYLCTWEGCDKRFSQSTGLDNHMRTHTGERPYKCPWEGCDKAFSQQNSLNNHIKTHTGEKPYSCSWDGCDRRFAQLTCLNRHMQIHKGEKPYACGWNGCHKAYRVRASLDNHLMTHTTDNQA